MMAQEMTGLFGPSPYEVQQARNQQMNTSAENFAQMNATQRGVMGMYQGGAGLAGIGAGMMGMVDPAVQQSQSTSDIQKSIDHTTSEGLLKGAAELQNVNPKLAIQYVQAAQAMKEKEAETAYKKSHAAKLDAEAKAGKDTRTQEMKNAAAIASSKFVEGTSEWISEYNKQLTGMVSKDIKAPPLRTIVKGDQEVQQEMQPDGTWKDIGKGPRFSRQASVVVNQAPKTPEEAAQWKQTVDYYSAQSLAGDNSWQVGLARGKVGQQLIAAVKDRIPQMAAEQSITPDQAIANKQELVTKGQALKSFTSGPEAKTVRSFGVAIDHLDTLGELGKALSNGDTRAFNALAQNIASLTGSAAPTNFDAAKQTVAAEVEKAIIGGATALGDRQTAAENIKRISSPAQLVGYVDTVKKLMAGQLIGLKTQYETSTGRKDFHTRLSPKAAALLGASVTTAPDDFNARWATLKSGQSLVGPDGKTYTKK